MTVAVKAEKQRVKSKKPTSAADSTLSINGSAVRTGQERQDNLTLSQFVEQTLFIDGRPFTFKGRRYLRRVYDQVAPFTQMMAARAVEKSTWLCSRMVGFGMKFPYFRNLYISASLAQAIDFSRDQLDQRLQSPWVRERHFDPKSCDASVQLKSFTNGTKIRLRHVYNTPDRIRGLRADQLLADEIQDIQARFMPIAEECLVQSQHALRVVAGTPKTLDNLAEYYWRRTTQEQWVVKCHHCWKWQDGGLDIKNIGKLGPICRYCGDSIDVEHGLWVAYGDGDEGRRLGFRVPQLIIPYYQHPERWRGQILEKLETYSLGQFYNEVLGVSYDDADKPVTEAEIKRLCIGRWIPQHTNIVPRIPIFAGVDWGSGSQSKTVIIVGGFVSKHKFQVFYGHIFKPVEHPREQDVIDEIVRVCLQWNVVAVGCDYGFGYMQNRLLKPRIGDDCVWEFQNVGNQRADIMWNRKSQRFQHNYVQTLSQLFTAIKEQKLIFPRFDRWKEFSDMMLNARREYNWSTGHVSYVNSPDRPDDALHALNYAYMAGRLFVHDWLQRQKTESTGRTKDIPYPHFLRR